MSDAVLTVYTSTICQPCRTAKARLKQAGVPFEEFNLEENPELLEDLKRSLGTPQVTTPLFRWHGALRQIDALTEIIRAHKEGL